MINTLFSSDTPIPGSPKLNHGYDHFKSSLTMRERWEGKMATILVNYKSHDYHKTSTSPQ